MTSARAGAAPTADLYPRLLGPAWLELDPAIRSVHLADGVVTATLEVREGRGPLARLLRAALGLPTPGDARETRLLITREAGRERWTRTFGRRRLVTVQRALSGGILGERIGFVELRFRLRIAAGTLWYEQTGAALALGSWSMPLPRWLSPRVEARERREDGGQRAHVEVRLFAPVVGFVMSYEGCLQA